MVVERAREGNGHCIVEYSIFSTLFLQGVDCTVVVYKVVEPCRHKVTACNISTVCRKVDVNGAFQMKIVCVECGLSLLRMVVRIHQRKCEALVDDISFNRVQENLIRDSKGEAW